MSLCCITSLIDSCVGAAEPVFPWLDQITGGIASALAGDLRGFACFQCRDKCITYSWRCDGEVDCYGAEDEAACEYICPYQTNHRCSDTGLCIDNRDLCDGPCDCNNCEDERNCGVGGGPWMGKRGIPILQEKSALNYQASDTKSRRLEKFGYKINSTDSNADEEMNEISP